MTLDTFDRRILEALQNDGTLTNAALSELISLSASQCSRRRAALEEAGYITGYHARLNAAKLGFSVHAKVRISLRAHGRDDHQKLTTWLSAQPEVKSAHSITGSADYILELRVRDLDEFADFVHEKLMVLPQVGQIQSDFVLKTLKDSNSLNLAQ